jgi:hypothetical protein
LLISGRKRLLATATAIMMYTHPAIMTATLLPATD